MSYVALYNKYRPSSLDQIVGQDFTIKVLLNSIKSDNLASTIILSGSYGVGKTSIARIIAKSINCETGVTTEPCNQCRSCVSVISGDLTGDILELDAASNNGVEDIRSIVENASYLPIYSRYKVYIIDEAHMLSKGAFNALLKIFEECYAHVKFIMATTEIEKIPLTIISRAQRFFLQRVPEIDQIKYMKKIIADENISFDDEALKFLATISKGSMRDAISLVEQSNIYTEGQNKLDKIKEMLGYKNSTVYANLGDKILNGEYKSAVDNFKKIYNSGESVVRIFQNILDFLYSKISDKHNIDDKNSTDFAEREKCIRVWNSISSHMKVISSAHNHYQAGEILVLQLAMISTLPSPSEIIEYGFETLTDKNSNISSNAVTDYKNKISKILSSSDNTLISRMQCVNYNNGACVLRTECDAQESELLPLLEDLFAVNDMHFDRIDILRASDEDKTGDCYKELIKEYFPNTNFREVRKL
ncbi:DNA polymerase III subunit gamma/tau [Anaplasmataceae bacterium AB001_6]|nr:DNA polymerase III subunit gamma/tau [Anaplasmataceae bacterium AB001_6]